MKLLIDERGRRHIDEIAADRAQVSAVLVGLPAFALAVVVSWGAPSFLFAFAISCLGVAVLCSIVGSLVYAWEWLRLHFLAAFCGRGVMR